MNTRPIVRVVTLLAGVATLGCSLITDPFRPDVTVSLDLGYGTSISAQLDANIGGRTLNLDVSDAKRSASAAVKAPRYGELPVHVKLSNAEGAVVAEVDFMQTYQRNHRHWVSAFVARTRPAGHCVGRIIAATNTITSSTGTVDSVFFVHGDIPNGSIC